jgi:hypothetical protein
MAKANSTRARKTALVMGFTPFPRTVWLSLNPASDAFPAAFFFLDYGIARYSRRYLSAPQPGFDTGDDIFAPV